jgi:hypothetical protein
VTPARRRIGRGASLLLLPLSILPFLFVGPQLLASQRHFDRLHNSGPRPVPAIVPSAAELESWQPLPAYRGAVPVLVYRASVTRLAFARQMEMLARAGMRTNSIHQYARFRRGEPAGMPPRAVLITFDGGQLDSYRDADKVLQRHGFRATMFVSPGAVARQDGSVLTWRELKAMHASGRWDVQPTATVGAARVAVDAAGRMMPFYAYRRYTRSLGEESFPDWQARASSDVFAARRTMLAQGLDPVAFAIPYGDYGQRGSNDARIAPYLHGLLSAQFAVAFGDHAQGYTARSGDPERYAPRSAGSLYAWLRAGDPGAIR